VARRPLLNHGSLNRKVNAAARGECRCRREITEGSLQSTTDIYCRRGFGPRQVRRAAFQSAINSSSPSNSLRNTGLEVESVDKDSDGFERFDDILSKNDKSVKVERKATRRSTRRSGAAPLEDVQEENDDDEESMSLDEQSSKRPIMTTE
jgi:hypothetical protein